MLHFQEALEKIQSFSRCLGLNEIHLHGNYILLTTIKMQPHFYGEKFELWKVSSLGKFLFLGGSRELQSVLCGEPEHEN